MIPGPLSPPAGLPPSSKRLENTRSEPPKDTQDSSRFEAKAEDILEALAQSARLHPPGQAAAAPLGDRPSGPEPSRSQPAESTDELSLGRIGGDERRENPFDKLNRSRQSYGTVQERQRTALRPPGSLLDFEA